MERVGLIGVGLLGSAMAERLIAEGYGVLGFDTADPQLALLKSLGGEAAGSAREVAAKASRVIVSLPHSGVTASVLDEIECVIPKGALIVDTTTGEPAEMEAFGRRLSARGVDYVDATVAGSSAQVRARQSIVMAGAEPRVYERSIDLFGAIAARWFLVGPCGAGARMKLVVNLVLGLNRAVLAEGLSYAEACGVDPAMALEVLKASPAYSMGMDVKGVKMLTRDYRPEARLRQHHKDVRLILKEAAAHGARVPLSELHDRLLEEAEESGFADQDNSSILEVFRRRKDQAS